MQTQDKNSQGEIPLKQQITQQLQSTIAASQKYLQSIQYPQGYWMAELESNVTITAEMVLLHKIWQITNTPHWEKVINYLFSKQASHGGWELFYGDGGDLSTSVEAYMALKLLGIKYNHPKLIKARKFIIQKGGITKTRIFTKIHLALIGCYQWRGIPSIPPWIMLFPHEFPFNIYSMSSWARSSTVPLIIVCDKKPVFVTKPGITLDELYVENIENIKYELPRNNDISDVFIGLDDIFKISENINLVPFREEGLRAAEKWLIERQEVSGDWGGIIPAMLNSLLALRTLNYNYADPIVKRGFKAIDNFGIESEDSYCTQACVSPVWDTAWCLRALRESGLPADDPILVRGGEWILEQQILDYGDWQVKNPQGKPGGWAFEFDNRFYPDLDDSAVVIMALDGLKLPDEDLKRQAMIRCVDWMETMQCVDGGWAAFDIDNNSRWLNELPYSDLKATIDPNTADVTARVLEMLGVCDLSMDTRRVEKALAYLESQQEEDGSWFGRWGVNYIYGTSGVLSALAAIAPHDKKTISEGISQGVTWLIECQNSDGGWGETCHSYNDSTLKGKGISTASQTAWALIGLIDASFVLGKEIVMKAICNGVNFLITTQKDDGTWDELEFTGTGFPCHFYLKYHLYRQYFPLIALSRFNKLISTNGVNN